MPKKTNNKLAIVVHGGAGTDSDFIRENFEGYQKGLEQAAEAGYKVLEGGGHAVEAVEAAVRSLEDNPLFNAGRGSALNALAEVEMCASIMRGENMNSGAVAIVKNVRNPITLARAVMDRTDHIYLGQNGALSFAQEINIELEPEAYFITEHMYHEYQKKRSETFKSARDTAKREIRNRMHGTVGAVACDREGNIAAGTSTGGTEFQKEGRIGDTSMIGVGTYANNKTCAVSTTGDGEYMIRGVVAFDISAAMEYKGLSVQQACDFVIHEKNKDAGGDMGVIAVDAKGNIGIAFNSERLHRAYKTSDDKETTVLIYDDNHDDKKIKKQAKATKKRSQK